MHHAAYPDNLLPRPAPGSGILDADALKESYAEALTDATIEFWTSEPLVENVPATFYVTVTLADPEVVEPPAGPEIRVGLANRASLTAECGNDDCEFEIAPSDPIKKTFAEDSNSLQWDWKITPRTSGEKILTLDIQPDLILPEGDIAELGEVNRTFDVSVEVHPARAAVSELQTNAEQVELVAESEIESNEPMTVVAQMALPEDYDPSVALIALDLSGDMLAVQQTKTQLDGSRLTTQWEVTGGEPGAHSLSLFATVTAEAGDLTIEERTSISEVDVLVLGSVGESSTGFFTTFTSIFTVVATLVTIYLAYLALSTDERSRLRRRLRLDDGLADDGEASA